MHELVIVLVAFMRLGAVEPVLAGKEPTVRVKCGMIAGLVACALGLGCQEQGQEQSLLRSLEVQGTYSAGFEFCEFRPSTEQFRGQCWWLNPNEDLTKRYREIRPKADPHSIEPGPAVSVRVRGRLIGPGQYGHLGRWQYQFSVDELLEMK